MPLSDANQTCLDFRLTISPTARVFAYDLPVGRVHHFNVRERHLELKISGESLVVTQSSNPFAQLQLVTNDTDFYARPDVRQKYYEYLQPTRRVPFASETDRIATVARKQAGIGTASMLIALIRLLHRAFSYSPGSTTVNTSLQQVLENKQGVCQDFAHLMLSVCRKQGIPARYVSGYLYTGEQEPSSASETNTGRRADDQHIEGSSLNGINNEFNSAVSGASSSHEEEAKGLVSGNAMHAWVECLMPDERWRGFDPTNNMVTNDFYVKVHHGRDYGDVLPVRGLYRGPFAHTLDVSVHVLREQDRR